MFFTFASHSGKVRVDGKPRGLPVSDSRYQTYSTYLCRKNYRPHRSHCSCPLRGQVTVGADLFSVSQIFGISQIEGRGAKATPALPDCTSSVLDVARNAKSASCSNDRSWREPEARESVHRDIEHAACVGSATHLAPRYR